MGATHLPSIVIAIALAAVPAQSAGFSSVLLLVDEANGNGLNGERYVVYTNASDASDDQTSGYISSSTLLAVQVAFSQTPAPATFTVGRVDTGGGESYADGLDECIDAGADFYGVCADSRADADILSVSASVEALNKFYAACSADATWLTSGLPAGLTALSGRERTAVVYHDAAITSAWPDVAWACNRLAWDVDSVSVPWNVGVQNVPQLTTAITDAQRLLLLGNNCNAGLPFASATDVYIYQGLNMNGRQIHEIVSADWFETRLLEQSSALIAKLSSLGKKLPLNTAGQAQVISVVNGLYAQGRRAGHFAQTPDANGNATTEVTGESVTAADKAALRLRFTGRAQLLQSATDLSFSFNFSPDALT